MFSRGIRNSGRIVGRRFQHHSAGESISTKPFNNRYNFNINPPPVHEYWNYRNASVLIAIIPVYLGVAYFAKSLGENLEGFEGLRSFADSDKSPLKELKFGEAQTSKSK
ncbi:uncharacterized protein RJT21DRAFT_118810 [Scheffersomyces amazonensis]|uniref:uncharacterized protein n=1 Tax=Scheffersomyces amazonensis TaxID=1078765 RepID=UPI00315DB1F0